MDEPNVFSEEVHRARHVDDLVNGGLVDIQFKRLVLHTASPLTPHFFVRACQSACLYLEASDWARAASLDIPSAPYSYYCVCTFVNSTQSLSVCGNSPCPNAPSKRLNLSDGKQQVNEAPQLAAARRRTSKIESQSVQSRRTLGALASPSPSQNVFI